MTVSLNAVSLYNGGVTATAPLIEGSAAGTLGDSSFDMPSGATGRRGMRITFASALDFTGYNFVSFAIDSTRYGPAGSVDTVANGGYRVVFVDGSGNYSGFNIYGSDIPNYEASNGGFQDGFFVSYNPTDLTIHINKARTPNISSGTLNWTNVTAMELTANLTSSDQKQVSVGRLCKRNSASFTGTETLASLREASNGASSSTKTVRLFQRTPYFQHGASGVTYSSSLGLAVGNGSTTTNWTEANFALGFENTYDKSPTYRSTGPLVQLDSSNARPLTINQSASDTLALSDFSIASAAWWQWELSGSGTASCSRGQFWRFNGFTAGHGTYTDCVWDGGEAAVSVTSSTVITRGSIRNGVGHGLKITSGAGTYSNLDVDFSNNSTYDIELGSGGAGTYDLSAVGVVGSYTLKVRNDSATNAITVAIPAGITVSSSTAGGSITISTPGVYQEVVVSGFTAGSRLQIYDTTSSTELFNGTASAGNTVVSGTTATWTDSVAASASRAVRVRISKVSGATADQFKELTGLTCGTSAGTESITYPVTPEADAVYNANAINGSTVTGITFTDAATDLVNIDVASNAVTWPQIYAAFVHWMSTASGIADDIAYIAAKDTANYTLTSMKIKNTSSPMDPLVVSGGYGIDSTTGTSLPLVDTTGGTLIFAPDHVVAYQTTGTYAITGDISTVLAAIPSDTDNAAAVRTNLATELARIDVATSTRLATAGYTAPDNAGIADIDAKTEALADIQAKTDQLTFTTGKVHADAKSMNGAAITGTGTSGDKWRGV